MGVSFYTWSSLSSMDKEYKNEDGGMCNTMLSDGNNAGLGVNVALGIGATVLSLTYSAYSTAKMEAMMGRPSAIAPGPGAEYANMNNEETNGDHDKAATAEEEATEIEFGGTETIKPLMTFHFIMLICSMYMVMTVTNWQTGDVSKNNTLEDFGTGDMVMWGKTISQWCTIVFYVLTVIAPCCCQQMGVERNFDFSNV